MCVCVVSVPSLCASHLTCLLLTKHHPTPRTTTPTTTRLVPLYRCTPLYHTTSHLISSKSHPTGTFIEIFDEETKNIPGDVTHLLQGTLYPDVIESVAFKVSYTTLYPDVIESVAFKVGYTTSYTTKLYYEVILLSYTTSYTMSYTMS